MSAAIWRDGINPSMLSNEKHVSGLRPTEYRITTQKICAMLDNYSAS